MREGSVYLKRVADPFFALKLRSAGAIQIVGPKWCGKTRTAEEMSRSALYCEDPDERDAIVFQAKEKPSVLLEGDVPRLIDEWQVAPAIWDAVRFAVDRRSVPGQFILTGSAVPNIAMEEERMHSGTGRVATVRMRPMSLFESLDSDGSVSLKGLFDGMRPSCSVSKMTQERLAFLACRGGWPSSIRLDEEASLETAKNYVESIVNYDCRRVDGVRRDNLLMRRILRSYSRLSATRSDITAIQKDAGGNAEVSTKTVGSYLNALEKLYVIEDIPSWAPSMVSKARMRKAPKRCLADPSIAAASLGIAPGALVRDRSTFGILFELLADRDLRVYSQPIGGRLFHYHDNTGLEVDAIIELEDGRWGAVEIKLDRSSEDRAADALLLMSRKVRDAPEFLMVLTGTGTAHVRDDGVLVVPIGCLRDRLSLIPLPFRAPPWAAA